MENEMDVIITMRILMNGKEIGGIIGKGGANIEGFREKSGARIAISKAQASAPERIVTITGGQAQIRKACELITEKINKDLNAGLSNEATNQVPVTLRLIVPASQCGSIIGKGGVKIKEIRDTTGCSIQVQSEMLPNSSERAVTLSGAPTTIIHCIDMLIDVMIQYPAKTATVPYRPQGANPIIFHQGQAFMLQGQIAVPTNDSNNFHKMPSSSRSYGSRERNNPLLPDPDEGNSSTSGIPSLLSTTIEPPRMNVNLPTRLVSASTQELTVGNDVMGCIIGKGGSRINEIRSLSGAQIKIAQGNKDEKSDESEEEKSQERLITISGSPEEISLAQYLINLSVQRFFLTEKAGGSQRRTGLNDVFGNSQSILGQPPSMASGAGLFGAGMAPGAYGAVMMSAKRSLLGGSSTSSRYQRSGGFRTGRLRTSRESSRDVDFTADLDAGESPNGKDKRKAKREKFQPY